MTTGTRPRETHKGLEVRRFVTAGAFDRWLQIHGGQTPGVWLRLAKKDSSVRSIAKADAIDVALCHGWIDGQLAAGDEDSWLIRFTPRTPTSRWSAGNRTRAERLIEAGRMRPAGLAQVEAARADGRWAAAYPSQSKPDVPADLRSALDASPAAARFFATLDRANRYAILYRVQAMKTPKGRSAKIASLVAMLERGEKLK